MNQRTSHQVRQSGRHRRDRAFTLVEAVMATMMVAVMLTAALQVVSTSTVAQYKTSERLTATLLAEDLMTEIQSMAYAESGSTPTAFGPDLPGETPLSKVGYDDVDDYGGWSESPPQDRFGQPIPGLTGWKRSVAVEWVDPTNLTAAGGKPAETGAKRITVTIRHNNATVATRVAIRCQAP